MKDFTGLRKGRLTVIERGESDGKTRKYKVVCDCGTEFWISDASLRNNGSSCGCLRKDLATKHGDRKTKLYDKWCKMKSRCYNSNDISYENYGGRGIKVYKPWIKSYKKFKDYIVSTIGLPEEKDQLDRIRVNGDYKPGNIRWLYNKENCNNKRKHQYFFYNGKNLTASQIYDLIKPNISREKFRSRLRLGWSVIKASGKQFYFNPKLVLKRRRRTS